MSVKTFDKDPEEFLDYGFDLTGWLSSGEQVSAVEATQAPMVGGVGLLVFNGTINTGTEVAVWVSGGTLGDRVDVSLKATTNNVPPRVFKRSLTIFVKKR